MPHFLPQASINFPPCSIFIRWAIWRRNTPCWRWTHTACSRSLRRRESSNRGSWTRCFTLLVLMYQITWAEIIILTITSASFSLSKQNYSSSWTCRRATSSDWLKDFRTRWTRRTFWRPSGQTWSTSWKTYRCTYTHTHTHTCTHAYCWRVALRGYKAVNHTRTTHAVCTLCKVCTIICPQISYQNVP